MNGGSTLGLLLGTAVTIAAVHTAIGVDHTLPFIALGRARNWELRKVLLVTALCGLGHVLSSVVLGFAAIALGSAFERIQALETRRGSLAAWSLVAFGGFFVVRSLWRMFRARPHMHQHAHASGVVHDHVHDHVAGEHVHLHPDRHPDRPTDPVSVWTLFIIFAFGPCEPLIPLLLAPAAVHRWLWVAMVVVVFGAVTIAVMVSMVAAGFLGLSRLRFGPLERHADLLAGIAIAGSGAAIQALGI